MANPYSYEAIRGFARLSYAGQTPEPAEYEILLCTGGPAVRIVGDLGEHNEPDRARLECQDWVTSWTEVFDYDHDTLMEYVRIFYFGE